MSESRLRYWSRMQWLKECKSLLVFQVTVLRGVVQVVREVQLWVVHQGPRFLGSVISQGGSLIRMIQGLSHISALRKRMRNWRTACWLFEGPHLEVAPPNLIFAYCQSWATPSCREGWEM